MLKKTKNFEGLNLAIENPAGTARMGRGWRTEMKFHYGYIPGTTGVDGDGIDVFFPSHKFWSNKIYVIHQRNPSSGEYDEDKLMCGFESKEHALAAYELSYDDPKKFLGPVTEWNAEELKEALKKSKGKPGKLDKSAREKWLSGRNKDKVKEESKPSKDLVKKVYSKVEGKQKSAMFIELGQYFQSLATKDPSSNAS